MFVVMVSCWHFVFWFSPSIYVSERGREVWFVIDEVLNWMLVPGFAYLLFASAPDWAKESVRFFTAGPVQHPELKPGLKK